MDTEIILIAAILVAICAFPFAYIIIKGNKATTDMVKKLQEIAGKDGYRITDSDYTGKIAIGVDDNAGILFFYKKEGGFGTHERIDLKKIKNCRLQKEWAATGNGAIEQTNLERLLLQLTLKNSSPKGVSLVFHDSNKDWQMNGELRIAEKWSNLINNRVSEKTSDLR